MGGYKVARDSITGRFITIHNAHRHPQTTTVEVIIYKPRKRRTTLRRKVK
jgi:hypothetical protein